MPDTAVSLLREAATQFRFYEMEHRSKAFALRDDPAAQQRTLAKALVNKAMADKIESFLGAGLCEDEGCPHAGSPHICISGEVDLSDYVGQGKLEYLPPNAS